MPFSIDDAMKNSSNYNWTVPTYQQVRENNYGMYYTSTPSTPSNYSSNFSSYSSSNSTSSFNTTTSFSSSGAQVLGKGRFAPY
jgi:hypothetical protein